VFFIFADKYLIKLPIDLTVFRIIGIIGCLVYFTASLTSFSKRIFLMRFLLYIFGFFLFFMMAWMAALLYNTEFFTATQNSLLLILFVTTLIFLEGLFFYALMYFIPLFSSIAYLAFSNPQFDFMLYSNYIIMGIMCCIIAFLQEKNRHNEYLKSQIIENQSNVIKDKNMQLKIINNKLQHLAKIDSLTGIANRRGFDHQFSKEWLRMRRSKTPLSVLLCDVDHFKKFNDVYGHLAGDECLVIISSILKNTINRGSDFVARYGGEEFIIVLPDTNHNGAKKVALKICKNVIERKQPHSASPTSAYVTISIGVVTVNNVLNFPPQQIINEADKALYKVKNTGRNGIFSIEI